jgi:hypothetical protein
VNRAAGLDVVKRQIVRDGRSLLQYVGEAFPYAPARAGKTRDRVEALAHEERDAVGRLIRFLQRHHDTPPVLGSFPTNFTTVNFVSLDHLLPALQKDQEHGIVALGRDIAALPAGEVRTLLSDYLEMKQRHLQALQEVCGADAWAEREHPSVIPSDKAQPAH